MPGFEITDPQLLLLDKIIDDTKSLVQFLKSEGKVHQALRLQGSVIQRLLEISQGRFDQIIKNPLTPEQLRNRYRKVLDRVFERSEKGVYLDLRKSYYKPEVSVNRYSSSLNLNSLEDKLYQQGDSDSDSVPDLEDAQIIELGPGEVKCLPLASSTPTLSQLCQRPNRILNHPGPLRRPISLPKVLRAVLEGPDELLSPTGSLDMVE